MYAYHIVQCTSVWYLNVFRIQLPVTVHYGTFGIVPSRWLHAMLILVWHVIYCFALDLDLLRWLWGMHLQVCARLAPRIHRVVWTVWQCEFKKIQEYLFQLTSYGTISMPHCLYGVTFERTCTPVSFNVSQILTSYQPSLQQCKLNKSYILQTWVNSKEAIHKSDQHVLKANQWDQCTWSQ